MTSLAIQTPQKQKKKQDEQLKQMSNEKSENKTKLNGGSNTKSD